MIVPQSELDLILNRRIRRRTIQLPIEYGKMGERKRCRVKPGGVYTLRARVPYSLFRSQAETQSTRALAVLWLVSQCEQPTKTATVTVRAVEAKNGAWVVSFAMGELELEHKPRLLKGKPGGEQYTAVPSMALPGCAEEIPEAFQTKYTNSAHESRKQGLGEQRERLLAAVGALRLEAAKLNAGNSISRRRLKSVEHQLRAFDREMRRCA